MARSIVRKWLIGTGPPGSTARSYRGTPPGNRKVQGRSGPIDEPVGQDLANGSLTQILLGLISGQVASSAQCSRKSGNPLALRQAVVERRKL